ncbi:hypothetical protein K438DRAFT_299760 [Mycena galopus ATCC 62051]|nr:hypothetical protein K438DRAFT_299760 [Mycena galopus ATCC 62051]
MATRLEVASRIRSPQTKLVDPANRLPLELLVEVFRCCDTSFDPCGLRLPDGLSVRQAPWLLTHVCQRWRAITVSSPQLWRQIAVTLSDDVGETAEGIYLLTKLFLERSAQSQIAVILTGAELQHQTWPVLDLLMSSSDRWDDLSIHADAVVVCGLSAIKGHLARLARLKWIRSEYDDELPTPVVLDMFSVAPCLSDVTFRYDPLFGSVLVPGRQLTQFTTLYSGLGPILEALREFVNLETLTLDRQGDEGNMERLPTASLPRLRELTVTTGPDQESHPGFLLDHLSLPASYTSLLTARTVRFVRTPLRSSHAPHVPSARSDLTTTTRSTHPSSTSSDSHRTSPSSTYVALPLQTSSSRNSHEGLRHSHLKSSHVSSRSTCARNSARTFSCTSLSRASPSRTQMSRGRYAHSSISAYKYR